MLAYIKIFYFFLFLPFALILYGVTPKKFRWVTLLGVSYIYYIYTSRKLVVFIILCTLITYFTAYFIDKLQGIGKLKAKEILDDKKEKKRIKAVYKNKQKRVLVLGIVLVLALLLYRKYFDFFAQMINDVLHMVDESKIDTIGLKNFILPLGISFYTMQAISYMTDVYWGKIPVQKNIGKLALYLAFFPTIMEGPIGAYSDYMDKLLEGNALEIENIKRGYIRIFWGLLKKSVVADRLYFVVLAIFDNYKDYHGVMIVVAAVFYTIQLYMEFSGCMDIVIGSGMAFGISLPENFRQPFLSQNASEFWRRWHISLGVWFKTYIFYPVSMSATAKKLNKRGIEKGNAQRMMILTSAMALFPVWFCNGLWHGPEWGYIFYGMYYFVVIMLELILEPLVARFTTFCKIKVESMWWKCIRVLKTWVIIFTGELFFRAEKVDVGFAMFKSMFRQFDIKKLWDGTLFSFNISKPEYVVMIFVLIVVGIVGYFKEKQVDIQEKISSMKLPIRWAIYMALIVALVMFGAYGPGFLEVDLIYAGF